MTTVERDLRVAIVESCIWMNANGINQGTSGNISARFGDRMLISPSAIPYDRMTPEMVASIRLDDRSGRWDGPLKPSTEWRMHQTLFQGREDIHAIVHAHPTFCTVLAMARMPIPPCHYMIAAFGGNTIRCADYATFGTRKLADFALAAMDGRMACLLANHGMISVGTTLDEAMWRATELETIARQYHHSLQIGGPALLSEAEVGETIAAFSDYGNHAGDG
ncbi:MAG: class II aldolase/adducin family protein [Boseongicola sp.]|nr:class II aldolase/adducin family protein [Boseongicola sp.]